MQSNTNYCDSEDNLKRTFNPSGQCMAKPRELEIFESFITPQVENQWYNINVDNSCHVGRKKLIVKLYGDKNVKNPDIEVIAPGKIIINVPADILIETNRYLDVIKKYSLKDKKAVFSTSNNLKFHIVAGKVEYKQGTVYVLKHYKQSLTYYDQEHICPGTDNIKSQMNIATIAEGWAESIGGWAKLEKNGSSLMVGDDAEWKNPYYYVRSDGTTYYKGMRVDQLKELLEYLFFDRTNSKQDSCQGRMNFVNGSRKISEGTISIPDYLNLYTYEPPRKVGEVSMAYFKNYYKNNTDIRNYEKKWKNFFEITGITPKEMAKLQSTRRYNKDKGTYFKEAVEIFKFVDSYNFKYPEQFTNSTNKYPNHFIYVAIDTSFNKGELGKNIFAFEQFGSKIIPVGYLANNQNTPLKFDVITRNPETFKLEKVNYYDGMEKRPLTFCEAMRYTGDKFSQYCDCKDGDKVIVTQYSQMAVCDNNFGCMIKPVSPSNVAPKFKLF